ncbi:hypothetical protein G9A89_002270 [Geosiphon pyriformis]|nr:hypothetical protein G9A89_002270 [Geosiphon pyriformis]
MFLVPVLWCVVTSQDQICLANIYRKKHVPITHPVSFGGKTWAQITSNSPFCVTSLVASGVGLILDVKPLLMASGIVKKLSFIELVPLTSPSCVFPLAVSTPVGSVGDSDMALDGGLTLFVSSFSGANKSTVVLSSSSSKVLTSKVGLESKMSALEASIGSVLVRLDLLCSNSSINVPAKQADIVHWHVSSGNMVFFVTKTKLRSSAGPWIKDKFDGIRIFTSGLDVGHLGTGIAVIMNNSLARHVSKVDEIPGQVVSVQLLFKSKFSVTVLGLYAGASEINSIIVKTVNTSTFIILGGDFNKSRSGRSASFRFCLGLGLHNSRGVKKTINYILVGENLFFTVAKHCIGPVSEFFDTDHSAIMVLVGLGGLLDLVGDLFSDAKAGGDLDTMWAILEKEMIDLADEFFGFELLISKIVSKVCSDDMLGVNCLVRKWFTLDKTKACVFSDLVILGGDSVVLLKHLLLVHKEYRRSKMFESRLAEEASIWNAIDKCMESFASNKGGIIRSVLNWSFCKMVFDHLVVDSNLVLEPKEMKSKVDKIMVGWTRVCTIPSLLPDHWVCQYMPLDYVRDEAFSGKHGGEMALSCLLTLLNACLSAGRVPPYDWDGVLRNMCSIALIKTTRKIFSKVLSDWILFACSKFGVFRGDNFLVLKSTSTQSLVFTVGAVVEDTFEKNRELWLVLQDMANLRRIKMCDKFIEFFSNIHEDRFNKVITDFGLSDGYRVKSSHHFCEEFFMICFYVRSRDINSFLDTGYVPSLFQNQVRLRAVVRNCQAAIQNILDIVSEFFVVNDIFINNKKTMAIPINPGVKVASLSISSLPISIAKKDEAYRYLRIFLSTERLSKLSIAKAYSDVHFFVNVVLRKAITDKHVVSDFFCDAGVSLASSVRSICVSGLNVLDFENFSVILGGLHKIWSDSFKVFTDGSLKNFGHANVAGSAAAYFLTIDLSIGVRVHGLLSSTMAKLQAIALSLECVLFFCTVVMHTNSQAAIDACISEMSLSVKVKEHSEILGNVKTDLAAGNTAFSYLSLPGTSVSDNTRHFVWNLPGCDVIPEVLIKAVDWSATTRLSVAVRKWLYDRFYPGVLCLLCCEMELPDHVFMCFYDVEIHGEVLAVVSVDWLSMVSSYGSLSSACSVDVELYSVLCKGFVLREWCAEAVRIFDDRKEAVNAVVGFVKCLVELHCSKIWLVRLVFRVRMEKAGLVEDDSLFSGLSRCLGFLLSDKVVRMLGVAGSFAVSFGCHKSCLFFSGLDGSLCVSISM